MLVNYFQSAGLCWGYFHFLAKIAGTIFQTFQFSENPIFFFFIMRSKTCPEMASAEIFPGKKVPRKREEYTLLAQGMNSCYQNQLIQTIPHDTLNFIAQIFNDLKLVDFIQTLHISAHTSIDSHLASNHPDADKHSKKHSFNGLSDNASRNLASSLSNNHSRKGRYLLLIKGRSGIKTIKPPL